MKLSVGASVETLDVALAVDPHGPRVRSAGEINAGESVLPQKKAMQRTAAITVSSHHFVLIVN